ncbi:L,D-transpeptidase [Actinomadura barringtoniae]|uniref:L,D-transpeptidase n=2 Tax=Actinomadura barringtoniae TaxID=1427535 RepID=A0A939PAQ0_9ACTN|nr:L,D-transpeptidase [Actinomadura barringtoniae]
MASPLMAACSQGASGHAAVSRPADRLSDSTTFTTVKGAPADQGPAGDNGGLVVHPAAPVPVLDRPGGKAFATLPTSQLGGATWVPVVAESGDWAHVLLPSRPNAASGWISTKSKGLQRAHTSYLVKVDVGRRMLTLLHAGRPVGHWKVAVGGPKTPTPAGRTFVLAMLKQDGGRLVLPLGTHSATLDSFGGGPGTVALHGWPDRSVFGKAVTHGCVRVPEGALKQLARVPLGSLVLITG